MSKNSNKTPYLTDAQIEFIVKRIAENVPYKRIVAWFKDAFGHTFDFDLSEAEFDQWLVLRCTFYKCDDRRAQKWKDLYAQHRQAWQQEVKDELYLTDKLNRLRELEQNYLVIPLDSPDKVLEIGGEEVTVHKLNIDARVKVLEQIRKEVEGDGKLLTETDADDATDELTQAIEKLKDG